MRLIALALVVATPDRPGQGTPACIVDKGHLLIETGVATWEHDKQPDSVTDTTTLGDFTARFGVTDRLEAIAGISAYNRVHERDRTTGARSTVHGVGDLLLGFKYSLAHPDGKGVSIAVQPFATAPTGNDATGAGGWTQGVIVPVSIDLTDDLQLGFSPEIDRLPDQSRGGHHAAYTLVTDLTRQFGKTSLGAELYASRDDDPGNRTTQASFDLTLAQTFGENFQVDGEVDAGLTHDTPDVRILVGFARRF